MHRIKLEIIMAMKMGYRMKVYMADKMIGCDQAGYLVSKSKETKLSFREKMDLRLHLFTCRVCRNYERQINDLHHIVDQYREQCNNDTVVHLLDPEYRNSLKVAVDRELKKY